MGLITQYGLEDVFSVFAVFFEGALALAIVIFCYWMTRSIIFGRGFPWMVTKTPEKKKQVQDPKLTWEKVPAKEPEEDPLAFWRSLTDD